MAVGQRRTGPKPPSQRGRIEDRDEIARVAYELYVQRDRQDGADLADWLQAETIVRTRKARGGPA